MTERPRRLPGELFSWAAAPVVEEVDPIVGRDRLTPRLAVAALLGIRHRLRARHLSSPTGSTTLRSGASAVVTLSRRYEYYWEEGPTGKPVRQRTVICPEIRFDPAAFDASYASGLVACNP
jgi:hypothetical protein